MTAPVNKNAGCINCKHFGSPRERTKVYDAVVIRNSDNKPTKIFSKEDMEYCQAHPHYNGIEGWRTKDSKVSDFYKYQRARNLNKDGDCPKFKKGNPVPGVPSEGDKSYKLYEEKRKFNRKVFIKTIFLILAFLSLFAAIILSAWYTGEEDKEQQLEEIEEIYEFKH